MYFTFAFYFTFRLRIIDPGVPENVMRNWRIVTRLKPKCCVIRQKSVNINFCF